MMFKFKLIVIELITIFCAGLDKFESVIGSGDMIVSTNLLCFFWNLFTNLRFGI